MRSSEFERAPDFFGGQVDAEADPKDLRERREGPSPLRLGREPAGSWMKIWKGSRRD